MCAGLDLMLPFVSYFLVELVELKHRKLHVVLHFSCPVQQGSVVLTVECPVRRPRPRCCVSFRTVWSIMLCTFSRVRNLFSVGHLGSTSKFHCHPLASNTDCLRGVFALCRRRLSRRSSGNTRPTISHRTTFTPACTACKTCTGFFKQSLRAMHTLVITAWASELRRVARQFSYMVDGVSCPVDNT